MEPPPSSVEQFLINLTIHHDRTHTEARGRIVSAAVTAAPSVQVCAECDDSRRWRDVQALAIAKLDDEHPCVALRNGPV